MIPFISSHVIELRFDGTVEPSAFVFIAPPYMATVIINDADSGRSGFSLYARFNFLPASSMPSRNLTHPASPTVFALPVPRATNPALSKPRQATAVQPRLHVTFGSFKLFQKTG